MPIAAPEAVALGTAAVLLRRGFVAVRLPGYQMPMFQSWPLIETRCRRIRASVPNWETILTVTGQATRYAVLTHYSLAADVPLEGSGIEFRFLFDGSTSAGVSLGAGGELSRQIDVTPWPCFKIPFFHVIPYQRMIEVQIRNLGANPRLFFAGLFGYFVPSVDPTTYNREQENRRG
jgi:hypothetical protein